VGTGLLQELGLDRTDVYEIWNTVVVSHLTKTHEGKTADCLGKVIVRRRTKEDRCSRCAVREVLAMRRWVTRVGTEKPVRESKPGM